MTFTDQTIMVMKLSGGTMVMSPQNQLNLQHATKGVSCKTWAWTITTCGSISQPGALQLVVCQVLILARIIQLPGTFFPVNRQFPTVVLLSKVKLQPCRSLWVIFRHFKARLQELLAWTPKVQVVLHHGINTNLFLRFLWVSMKASLISMPIHYLFPLQRQISAVPQKGKMWHPWQVSGRKGNLLDVVHLGVFTLQPTGKLMLKIIYKFFMICDMINSALYQRNRSFMCNERSWPNNGRS